MPAEQALSAVVVEADGRQRLWRLPLTGEPAVLLPDVIGVGYHAWGPADDVMLFIFLYCDVIRHLPSSAIVICLLFVICPFFF